MNCYFELPTANGEFLVKVAWVEFSYDFFLRDIDGYSRDLEETVAKMETLVFLAEKFGAAIPLWVRLALRLQKLEFALKSYLERRRFDLESGTEAFQIMRIQVQNAGAIEIGWDNKSGCYFHYRCRLDDAMSVRIDPIYLPDMKTLVKKLEADEVTLSLGTRAFIMLHATFLRLCRKRPSSSEEDALIEQTK